MSKYDALWAWIRENGTDSFNLTFAEIEQIAGVSIDHSFLASKKELIRFLPTATYELPYEGAKEMLLVDEVDNKEFLADLFHSMYEELPTPKTKKKK